MLLLCGFAFAARPAAAIEHVDVVLSESGGAYAEVAEAIRSELKGIAEITSRLAGESKKLPAVPIQAVVAVGTEACERAVKSTVGATPLLCVLVPRAALEPIARANGERTRLVSSIVLDQPLARQLALLQIALPERRRVAVLLGPQSKALAGELSGIAIAKDFRIVAGNVESPDDLGPVLQRTLEEANVLLAVPDGVLYNSQTIHNVLRTTFRMRVPMVAFSPAYVRAGALLSVYSTPAQIGRQAGRSIRALLSGRSLPHQQFPKEFVVSVNPQVARSLGIVLPDVQELASRLRALEGAQ